jgi:TonB family protein
MGVDLRASVLLLGMLYSSLGRAQQTIPPPEGVHGPSAQTKPNLQSKVEPVYPDLARKLRVEGTVTLGIVVNTDGRATNFRVVRPSGFGLDEKAIEAVGQWRFQPGTKDGQPVNVSAVVEVDFRLLRLLHGAPSWFTKGMRFAVDGSTTPPVVEDGEMPDSSGSMSDESVVLEFRVAANGGLTDIRATHGSQDSVNELMPFFSKWSLQPAMKGGVPVEASGRVVFVRGNGDDASRQALAK